MAYIYSLAPCGGGSSITGYSNQNNFQFGDRVLINTVCHQITSAGFQQNTIPNGAVDLNGRSRYTDCFCNVLIGNNPPPPAPSPPTPPTSVWVYSLTSCNKISASFLHLGNQLVKSLFTAS
jgi:hypothetical protein